MPDTSELERELRVTREKLSEAEDLALADRRRQAELAAADSEARAARKNTRGF